jgi:cytochrome c oxidase cbb3-type subunit 3
MSNDPKEPLLLDHDYDGIQEFDNQLPRWWVWLFYITIIFAAVYMVYYHVTRTGDLQIAEYNQEMKAGAAIKAAAMGNFESTIASLKPATDAVLLEGGRQTYAKFCAPCHRADGGGLVGPNLTDDYWIHGSNYVDTVKVIWDGVPAKGMITWKTVLKPGEIQAVASYIYTLRGAKLQSPGKVPENQAPAKPAGPSNFE